MKPQTYTITCHHPASHRGVPVILDGQGNLVHTRKGVQAIVRQLGWVTPHHGLDLALLARLTGRTEGTMKHQVHMGGQSAPSTELLLLLRAALITAGQHGQEPDPLENPALADALLAV